MPLFIRQNDELPVARLGYGPNHVAFELRGNKIFVDAEDEHLLFALRANGYEEVASDDPRYDFITREGWSRQAQHRYAVEHPPEEPN